MGILDSAKKLNHLFFLFVLATLSCFVALAAAPSARAQLPHYKLDASWPKELPHNWIMANPSGLFVDKNDHIWVVHRPHQTALDDAGAAQDPPLSECCIPAPSVLEFDTMGNLISSWGGPGYVPDWPELEFGLFIDKGGNFWIGGSFAGGNEALLTSGPKPKTIPLADRQVLKFSSDRKQLLEIGHPSDAPVNNQDTSVLGCPAAMFVDDAAQEVYIADGYMNRRLVVYDSNTGAFKRGWGAYGMPLSEIDNGKLPPYDPSDPPYKQFRGPIISIDVSVDGLVYVGDRFNDRIQVFTKEGKFVKEFIVHPKTLNGSIWGVTLSRDPQQKYLWIADGETNVIRVLDRKDGTEVGTIGHKGREPGQFDSIIHMAFDSKGNLYTAEVNHNTRIMKFVPEK